MNWADLVFWQSVIGGSIRLGTPVLIAALGETVVERSGQLNLGIEGTMLFGALAGVWGSSVGGPWFGLAVGIGAGFLLGLVMVVSTVFARANAIVVGIAVTFLGSGLASYLFKLWLPSGRTVPVANLAPTLDLPIISDFWGIGPILGGQSILTYLAIGLVFWMRWALRSTGIGLAIRAVGDSPEAAELRGVSIRGTRSIALLVGAALAGLAGAALTVGYLGSFTEGVTAGRGFVAIAVVIIARWKPTGLFLGTLLFSFFGSLALQAQTGTGVVPVELYQAMPYAITLIVLIVSFRRREAPRALAELAA